MRRGLRHRLALLFAGVVAAALFISALAMIGVAFVQARAHRLDELRRGLTPDDDDVILLQKTLGSLVFIAPLAIAGAGVVGIYLARRALEPMHEASRRAAVARASDLDLTLPLTGSGDEWDELARTLNALLADARGSMSRVRRFTADAAHELRTPITTILGEAELALRRERTAPELRLALATVKTEAERIAQLLEALLALARADAGTLLSSRTPVQLSDIVQSTVERARERKSQLGRAGLRIDSKGSGGAVDGNPLLLSRALENLLDNAIRYARAEVTVTLASDDGILRVRVADDGPGIAPDLVAGLFERFVRGDSARTGEGFGLGLSIARAIAEAHEGTVRHIPAGTGAVFELVLPQRGAAAPRPVAANGAESRTG